MARLHRVGTGRLEQQLVGLQERFQEQEKRLADVVKVGRTQYQDAVLTTLGREMGASLGCDPDLVEVAGLAHDLGHPPFGHNGEAELNDLAASIGGFEGNAQSFRLLTRLEPKALGSAGHPRAGESVGLNLTRAALDAASKYPWARAVGSVKFGVYDDDLDVFQWVRDGAPDSRTCIEAQVMDWADDVSYSVHDVEDAIHGGHMNVGIMASVSGRSEVIDLARDWYGSHFTPDGLDAALTRLQTLPQWPAGYDGTLRSLAAMKNLTSTLIGRFCQAATQATTPKTRPQCTSAPGMEPTSQDSCRGRVEGLLRLAGSRSGPSTRNLKTEMAT